MSCLLDYDVNHYNIPSEAKGMSYNRLARALRNNRKGIECFWIAWILMKMGIIPKMWPTCHPTGDNMNKGLQDEATKSLRGLMHWFLHTEWFLSKVVSHWMIETNINLPYNSIWHLCLLFCFFPILVLQGDKEFSPLSICHHVSKLQFYMF